MGFKRTSILLLLLTFTGMVVRPVWAEKKIHVAVVAVMASQGSEYSDPRLSDLIEELKSVFRYSSYRLLSENRVDLARSETGTVSLPGNRVLKITPAQISGNRVEMALVIFKNNKEIFQTVIQLLNQSSIIVGGPEYQDGYLLFNISAAF